jgi:glycosyltransferase involved in cell wall biosynthesis
MEGRSAINHDTMITLVSAYYLSHGGGMELACAELVRGLLAAGMQVEWVSQQDGVQASDLGAIYTPVPGTDAIYALTGVPMPLPMPWSLPTILRSVNRARVVIVVEANFALSVIAFLAAKLRRKPILLIQHVGAPSTVSRLARAVMRLGEVLATRPMVRSADAVVCVSPVVARYFAGVRSRSGLATIGHGVDTDAFRMAGSAEQRAADRAALGIAGQGKLACFVGRLTESKGISVIAEMARLRPDWTFVAAGIGPVEPANWRLPNVMAPGQLDRGEVARLYRASDALVLPSQSESFSLVVREALASGAGVLCSDQILETDPGLGPYITTETVDLSDVPATAARFAAALDRLPGKPNEDARNYVNRHCSWAEVDARYVDLVEGLMADRSAIRA